jgi:hypothetical protein
MGEVNVVRSGREPDPARSSVFWRRLGGRFPGERMPNNLKEKAPFSLADDTLRRPVTGIANVASTIASHLLKTIDHP